VASVGSLHGIHEFIEHGEQVRGIVRTRPRFGVVLHTECRNIESAKTFDHAVVEISMCDFNLRPDRAVVDRVVVVLARDLDRSGFETTDGMVAAVMAERKFVGVGTKRGCQSLVPETDAKDRNLAE
jgi:hypothetical protein